MDRVFSERVETIFIKCLSLVNIYVPNSSHETLLFKYLRVFMAVEFVGTVAGNRAYFSEHRGRVYFSVTPFGVD